MIYLACNLVVFDKKLGIYHRQQLCMESLKYIKDEIEIISCGVERDLEIAPDFVRTSLLYRDSDTILGYKKAVPFIKDLIEAAYGYSESNDDYIGLFNSDIMFTPWSVRNIRRCLKTYDAMAVQANHIKNCETLEEAIDSNEYIKQHNKGGKELFIFKRECYEKVMQNIPDLLLGEIKWDRVLSDILDNYSTYERSAKGIVKHIAHERKWIEPTIGNRYNTSLYNDWRVNNPKIKRRLFAYPELLKKFWF